MNFPLAASDRQGMVESAPEVIGTKGAVRTAPVQERIRFTMKKIQNEGHSRKGESVSVRRRNDGSAEVRLSGSYGKKFLDLCKSRDLTPEQVLEDIVNRFMLAHPTDGKQHFEAPR